jgi:AcrR family transcriptional regulator
MLRLSVDTVYVAGHDWLVGGDRRVAAADHIYAVATDLITRHGLAAFDIDTLAARVHCSRATIYRHVGGKTQIRDAVLIRGAGRIVDEVRRSVEGMSGPERVVTAISVALEQIRSDPLGRLMFNATAAAGLSELPASPVLAELAADLAGVTDDDPLAAQWIVRVVLSLVYWPIGDTKVEHEVLLRLVSPAFGGYSVGGRTNGPVPPAR